MLVRGPLPPLPEPQVVFSPGEGATFDGNRWHLSLSVVVEDDGIDERHTFDRTGVMEALDVVERVAERRTPDVIVLDGRDWLRGPLSNAVVERIETELGKTAGAEGAILVVRIWDEPSAEDRDHYDAVIDRTDGHAWRGEPADPPRRQYSRSSNTAPAPPSPDP